MHKCLNTKMYLCYSPNKSDFIRAKYQFLSFVNKQKDSDASSLDDVSKVMRHSSQSRPLADYIDCIYINPGSVCKGVTCLCAS